MPGCVGFASLTNQAMRSLILAPRFPEGDHRHGRPRPSTTGPRFPKGGDQFSADSEAQGCPVSCIASMRLAPVDKTEGQSLATSPVLPQAPDTHESGGF